jgi:hypothetical protein
MALSRYAYIALDDYTLEELRREYHSLGPKGRIRLLQRLAPNGNLHEKVRQLAVEDRNAVVRQWFAREVDDLYRDQIERLKNDPDELVRACLFEGPALAPTSVLNPETAWLAWFKEATHIQRLAMMRNRELPHKFIETVFDPEDTKLGIDMKVRAQFVFAILSNKRAVEATEWVQIWDDPYGIDQGRKEDKRHFATLWALAGKWPPDSGVPYHVYSNVSVDGETKVRAYSQCEDKFLRMAILENDVPELDERGRWAHGPSKVLKSGQKDGDEGCRELAFSKSPKRLEPTPVMNALAYGWAAALSICEMLVALVLLRSAATHSETVIYTLLVMIYVAVRLVENRLGLQIWQHALLSSQRHLRLLKLLRDPEYTPELRQTLEADGVEQSEDFRKTRIKLSIRSACLNLVGVATALYLVTTVVRGV